MYNLKKKQRRTHSLVGGGFTLIELLVVIAIIGILSSVVLVSLGKARKKGKYAHTVSTLKNVELAIYQALDDEGASEYWKVGPSNESSPCTFSYKAVSDIIAETACLNDAASGHYSNSLSEYLSVMPKMKIGSSGNLLYYRSTPDASSCGSPNAGTFLALTVTEEEFLAINKIIDGDNESDGDNGTDHDERRCGKIRYRNDGSYSFLQYQLSPTNDF